MPKENYQTELYMSKETYEQTHRCQKRTTVVSNIIVHVKRDLRNRRVCSNRDLYTIEGTYSTGVYTSKETYETDLQMLKETYKTDLYVSK